MKPAHPTRAASRCHPTNAIDELPPGEGLT